jgi:hypothetical protein
LHERIKVNPKGGERIRTAVLAMKVCQRAWNVARRSEPKAVPSDNPFQKMDLAYKAKTTRLFQYDDLQKFVAAADAAGEQSIGTAAMIAFFWLQREIDIIGRLAWSHFRPADAPHVARIIHHKTGEVVDLPLYDDDGTALWPDIMHRLDVSDRHGTLIVTRDNADRFKGIRLPWRKRHFLRQVAKIKTAAGIDPEIKFMGLRHGGNTEGADANLSDAQMRALSGHRTTAALLRYAQTSTQQRRIGARLRRNARTKGGQTCQFASRRAYGTSQAQSILAGKANKSRPRGLIIHAHQRRAEPMPARRVGNDRPHWMISHAPCARCALHFRFRLHGKCADPAQPGSIERLSAQKWGRHLP